MLSSLAVKAILGATGHQMRTLTRLGIIKSPDTLMSVGEIDSSLERLNALAAPRRKADGTEYVALSQFSQTEGEELELCLRDVLAGRTQCVAWTFQRPSGLSNIFISVLYARSRAHQLGARVR